jgi:hypothetical protein
MTTWKFALAIAIVAVGGCGPPANHVEAPTLPEPDKIEETESAEPAPVESEAAESEAAESKAAESESAEPAKPEPKQTEGESAAPAPPAKKKCVGLPKKKCEVTAGCAWSTTDNCVAE